MLFRSGKELIQDKNGTVKGLHEHADEPAASRRIGKQFPRVGRADEGGDARKGLAVPPVRLAQVEGGELHEVLQERVNMDAVKRIEVLKGASSALYGSDAIAGVINIITDDPIY